MAKIIQPSRIVEEPIPGTSYTHSYKEPAILECDCGKHVYLTDSMTNRCECGAFYNGSGQALSHPSQWGEETGEYFDDNGNQIL